MGAHSLIQDRWRLPFELAWASCQRDGMGVGAVVADANGEVVTTGRNRSADTDTEFRQLTGTNLAHAEINALARLDKSVPRAGLVLLTTLEPCGLCAMAIRMTKIQRVEFAGADPLWAGTGAALDSIPFLTTRAPVSVGPIGGPVSVLAEILMLSQYLRRGVPGVQSIEIYRRTNPALLDLAKKLATADVRGWTLDGFVEAWMPHLIECPASAAD